jgi:crotonobetainyl-CoA:carnitine CoA-transferase CaiB-like acyl-CoA transferase
MRILDLSCDVPGRFAAKLFAMAGCDIVRPVAAPPGDADRQPLDLYLDAHKRLEVVDQGGLAVLVGAADLIFSSFDRGRRQGLAAVAPVRRPQCVEVITSSFGMTGPYAGWRGGPLVDWAAGGYLAITGEPDRAPLIGPENLCGYATGYTAALAAETALFEAARTGVGREVDVSAMESMLLLHQSTFSRLGAGFVRTRTGRYPETYPLTVRPCGDGYVSIGVVTNEDFDRLTLAIGRPELALDPRFADPAARIAHRDALDTEMDAFFRAHAAADIETVLTAHDVACARVASPREVLENPQLAHRRYWDRIEGAAVAPGNPIPPAKAFAGEPPAREPQHLEPGAPPLAGVRVLDLTAYWAGPAATRYLADFGAEVFWIERPAARAEPDPATADPGQRIWVLHHCKMNRNKRSVVLDLREPRAQETARRLAATVDVLVENFRPGVLARLGLGAETLCATDPGLIYVSLSGFAAQGPWGGRRSFGPTIEAASSIEDRTGYLNGAPLRLGHTLPDGIGGVVGALAAVRGLRTRGRSGRGGWYDLSQLEAYVAMSGEDILAASRFGRTFPRIGNRSRSGAVQGVFPCRGEDQWIALRLADRHDAEALAGVLGHAGPPPFGADLDTVEAAIAEMTRSHDKLVLAEALQRAGVEAFAVLSPPELTQDPHLAARRFFVRPLAAGVTRPLPGSPFRASFPLANLEGPPPRLGEHTDLVAAELLRGQTEP